jgi:hypothetical protein
MRKDESAAEKGRRTETLPWATALSPRPAV